MTYDIIPAIDENDDFHPSVRARLRASPEFQAEVSDNRLPARLGIVSKDITDWNDAVQNGWYQGDNKLNPPAAGFFLVEVIAHYWDYLTQTALPVTGGAAADTKSYRRHKAGGVWGPWYKLSLSQAEQDARYQAAIAAGTTAQYWRGDKTWQTLNSTAVGLGNVNNTSDANKPVSTAQAAEDAKLAKGIVFRALVQSTSGSIVDAIVNNVPSFTFKANRNYRIIWDFSYYATGNSDSLFYCMIATAPTADAAASLANLSAIDGRTKGLLTAYSLGSTQHTGPITCYYSPGASDFTAQVKFRVVRVLGDDGLYVVGNANERAMYIIEDLGTAI